MCGIVGYVGKRTAKDVLINGLKKLEYRGYDSAGIAIVNSKDEIVSEKKVGKVVVLAEEVKNQDWQGHIGIAHTRWATHGVPSEANAHPHATKNKDIFVVHNGILENYAELRKELEKKGYTFLSSTDTEVLPHLIDYYYTQGKGKLTLEEAIRKALGRVAGTYGMALVSLHDPSTLYAARKGSPLVLGVGEDEFLVASDISALIVYTRNIVYLDDGDLVVVRRDGYKITDAQNHIADKKVEHIEWDEKDASKEGYAHFMLKEIFEQPEALANAMRGRIDTKDGNPIFGGLDTVSDRLRGIEKIIILSCGTSYYAGMFAQYFIEDVARIPVQIELASEFRYKHAIVDDKTLIIAVSQSGETADTIAALKEAKMKGAMVLGVVNVVGSTIARMTDAGVYTHAGPEIGVASTKALVTQLGVLSLIGIYLGRQRELSREDAIEYMEELVRIQKFMKEFIDEVNKTVKKLAKKYSLYKDFLYIGRKYNYPMCLEGALKLKEISYIHAEGYASGEMKHGPIALIDDKFPTVAIIPKDSVYEKNRSNIEEIRARGGKILAIVTKGDTSIRKFVDDVIEIPKIKEELSVFFTLIPLQLLAYYVAVELDRDPDKPRNLAKSVTVE
jgi:glucosamine--fructose-6-phosphate aminotransferase (isomerizing)